MIVNDKKSMHNALVEIDKDYDSIIKSLEEEFDGISAGLGSKLNNLVSK